MLRLCIGIILNMSLMIRAQMEGFIVGGANTTIKRNPHSAFLVMKCGGNDETTATACGASILNQVLLLTAAHCLYDCINTSSKISIFMGNIYKMRSILRHASKWLLHEEFDPIKGYNDIAILKMARPVGLNATISRVAIMKNPPYFEPARIAGWGMIKEDPPTKSPYLKEIAVKVWKRKECKAFLGNLHDGILCATGKPSHYVFHGDSGSALIVRGYIQLGIVSAGIEKKKGRVALYTDIGYYFNWITKRAKTLYCV